MKRLIAALLASVLTGALAIAQPAPQGNGPGPTGGAQISGTPSVGHVTQFGPGAGFISDGGGSAGGPVGANPRELGVTSFSQNGVYPVANGGNGPKKEHVCFYDAPNNPAVGYHYLCMDPNAQGAALLDIGSVGPVGLLSFNLIVNGVTYPFVPTTGNVVGPGSSTNNDLTCWNGTTGTVVKDCGPTPQGILLDTFKNTGDADYTAALTRAVAAGVPIALGPHTYTINNFVSGSVPSFVLRGIPGYSVIQRTSASGSDFFNIGAANVVIDGVTFDMNSGSVSANQWGVRLNAGSQTISIRHSVFENNSGTVAYCLVLLSTGPAAGGSFNISDNEFKNCTGSGPFLGSVSHGIVSRNYIHDTGAYGIWASAYPSGTSSSTNFVTDVVISNNLIERQVDGIALGGWGNGIFSNTPASYITVSANHFVDDTGYAVVAGMDHLKIDGNIVGQVSATIIGGLDCLCRYTTLSGNTVAFAPASWGIDVGGSVDMTVADNTISMSTGIALNVGGNANSLINHNHIILSGAGLGVEVEGVESSGAGVTFPTLSQATTISNNQIDGSSSATGINIVDDAGDLGGPANVVKNNNFNNFGSQQNALSWVGSASSILIDGNTINGANVAAIDPNGSGDVIFDAVDYGWTIRGLSSTTNVRAIVPRLIETYSAGQSILYVKPTAGGANYTAATVLAASGSTGGSGWVGTPMIYNGAIIGVRTSAFGSGYTGTITVTATDTGGGSGATFSVGTIPRLPNNATIKYQPNQTALLQHSGGAVALTSPNPLQLSAATEVDLRTAGNSNGLSWTVDSFTIPTFAGGSLPACSSTASGAEILITGGTGGRWIAQCNATNWIYPDGTTAP